MIGLISLNHLKGRCGRIILKFEVSEVVITEPRLEGWNGKYEGVGQVVEKWEEEKGLEVSVKYKIK